jgi:hypothetical protein
MKILIMAGLFTLAMTPLAAAAESTTECQLDEARRAAQTRVDPPASASSTARPTAAPRVTAEETPPRQDTSRRRSVKRIPDAELIGPRGAL